MFDVAGRLVKTLVDGYKTGGQKTVSWDGKNGRGAFMSAGVYFCRMQAGDYQKAIKMTLVK